MSLEVRSVSVDAGPVRILDDVSLTVHAETTTAVVGPNGAGKTTLLRAILGLVAHSGDVLIDGRTRTARSRARAVAYVPQRPERPPGMTVVDYVSLGRTPHLGYFSRESDRDVLAVREAMTVMDLSALAMRDVATLSGGEAQRVALARAVAQEVTTLILDEPTTGLDIGRQQEVMALIDGLRRARGLTVLATTHDLTLAGHIAEQVVLLSEGKLIHHGRAADVITPEIVATHYGADVSVVADEDGHQHIVPRRISPPKAAEETTI